MQLRAQNQNPPLMKQTLLTIIPLFVLLDGAFAQRLTVESMVTTPMDISASIHPRMDLNDNPCALVKLMMVDDLNRVEGNVIGDVENHGTEKWIYLSEGTKMIKIIPEHHLPVMVTFVDYGLTAVEGKMTYELILTDQTEHRDAMSATTGPDIQNEIKTFVVDTIPFRMIHVEGGTFQMGTSDKDAMLGEQNQHSVTLSGYYIGETEVSQELWVAVMGTNPSFFNYNSSKRPVECISWSQCQEFIRKLGEKTGHSFRLPTEAEWEFAARGGNMTRNYKYSGSDDLASVAWYSGNSKDSTHDIGTTHPNELGLYDMSGNVKEWCQDVYKKYGKTAQTNPMGPSNGETRVIRGGDWRCSEKSCRVAIRDYSDSPTSGNSHIGLRLAF